MNTIREWSTVICFAAIACTILELISPNGTMEKLAKFVISTFMMCAIISPLTGTISKISVNIKNHHETDINSDFKKKVSEQTLDVCSSNIETLIKNELNKLDLFPKKINVIMDTEDLSSISIIKTKVYFENQPRQDVKQILEDKLGITAEIIYGSD